MEMKLGWLLKMKNKILLTIILGMFLLTLASAIDPTYFGKQYEDINIVETCTIRGFPCPSDYLCNITVSDPDLNVIVLNSPMTKNDTIYNYTFVSTDLLGDYDYNVYCDNITYSGNEEGLLRVTTTGREPNMMITILLLLCSLGLFVLALYLKNYAMGFLAGILFLVSGVYLMVTGLGDLADLYTRAIAGVIIAFGGFVTLVAGIEWLEEVE